MKKLIFVIPILLVLVLAVPVLASNDDAGSQGTSTQTQQQLRASPSPTGSAMRFGNEDEQETNDDSQKGEGLQTRSETALQNMSGVAEQVQAMLQLRTAGGIGEQVRMVAQEQNQAQEQITEQVKKISSKNPIVKFLTGSDYFALKTLRQQLEQNQLRIAALQQLQNQLSNQSDITIVQESIKAMTEQNTSLQAMITAEEKTFSLFGWLFKQFAR